MLRHIRKFTKLNTQEKVLFLQAFILLGIIRIAILTRPFKQIIRPLRHHNHIKPPQTVQLRKMKKASLVGEAITRAAKITPWESACLAQALTGWRMLQRQGIPGVIYLGVCKENETSTAIKAHAWAKCGESIITGAQGHKAFTVVSAFEWPGL